MSESTSFPVTEAERKARSALPITRLITAYMPVWFAQWVIPRTTANMALSDGITRQPVSANGVACDWLIPDNSPKDKVLLYLHGGGFIFAASTLHYDMVAHLAKMMGVRALMVDYRLAPKHPFPAALDDCVSAYQWLLTQGFSSENIVIAGDSAGGNLTLTTVMHLRDNGESLPAATACLSPVGDLSKRDNTSQIPYDTVLHPKAAKFMAQSYVADNDASQALISPLFGDWQGLPPLLIHVGEEERLRSSAVDIAKKARDAGVDVRLEIYPRMWHVWQITPDLPQTKHSLDDIAQFLISALNP